MGFWNTNDAWVDRYGNLSLGQTGLDDGAGDATHRYAKDDVRIQLDITNLRGIPVTNLTMSDTRTAVGQYNRLFTAGAAITPNVPIYIPLLYRTLAGLLNARTSANPHGMKVTAMYLNYYIATAAATSIAVVFTSETVQVDNTARTNASTTPLGAITYENPVGTVVSTLPVATQAAPYVCKIVPATPAFLTTNRQGLTAEIQLSLPNTCVVAITDIWLDISLALY